MSADKNPFPEGDPERYQIWQMLVERDIEAFLEQSWDKVADDFVEKEFLGIHAHESDHPDSWTLSFTDLASYRDAWLAQSKEFAENEISGDPRDALFRVTTLRDIEIEGDRALVHKKFDGHVPLVKGGKMVLQWQTLYWCRKVGGVWKISGFTGYLPHPIGSQRKRRETGIHLPKGATQHAMAGPYSPILEVSPGKLVVISGQASIDPSGSVVGSTIEEQSRFTLENCQRQLAMAECRLDDVFKVNVYMQGLDHWERFNAVYQEYMPDPKPVRTAVQTGLLSSLLVEVEMWAVKP